MVKRITIRCIALFLFLAVPSIYAAPFDNCREYTRVGVPSNEGDLLCRKGYALAHNPLRKTAFWVAEHLTEEKVSAVLARSNNFQADPDLDEGERSEPADYKKSGYDQGHMAPAGDMRWDTQAMSESFFLSNMAPQVGVGMNRGIWKNLEELVRDWAQSRGELYVFTGPIYPERGLVKTIGENRVAVPTHFYKIIYDPTNVEAIAFIMPNKKLNASDMAQYIVTIREVEEKTKLNFLSKLKKRIQEAVETEKAEELWQ